MKNDMRIPVIHDGDMGGDDLWAVGLMLGNPHRFHLQGVTTVYGNVSRDIATANARNFLNALGYGHIPVHAGAKSPLDGTFPFGDDAYGENGVGGVTFPDSPYPAGTVSAIKWMQVALLNNVQKTTIFATGPATNIAALLDAYPDTAEKIERVVFMAGADQPPGKNGQPVLFEGRMRRGNITPRAEFNAFQDPHALNRVIASGVACHFLTMDSNQHLVLTPERAAAIRAIKSRHSDGLAAMMNAVADLDRAKFGVDGPFVHDPHVVLYALDPDNYTVAHPARLSFNEAAPGEMDTTLRGEADFGDQAAAIAHGNVTWATGLKDPHRAFWHIVEGFGRLLSPRKAAAPQPSR